MDELNFLQKYVLAYRFLYFALFSILFLISVLRKLLRAQHKLEVLYQKTQSTRTMINDAKRIKQQYLNECRRDIASRANTDILKEIISSQAKGPTETFEAKTSIDHSEKGKTEKKNNEAAEHIREAISNLAVSFNENRIAVEEFNKYKHLFPISVLTSLLPRYKNDIEYFDEENVEDDEKIERLIDADRQILKELISKVYQIRLEQRAELKAIEYKN